MREKKPVVNTAPSQNQPMSLELGPFLQFRKAVEDKSGTSPVELTLSDGRKLTHESKEHFFEAMKKTTGTDDFNYSINLLAQVSRGMRDSTEEQRLTRMSSLLPTLRPQDETEALLAGQFLALQNSAMDCLRQAHFQDGFYHVERYMNLATKLFNVANQTMQVLLKYRSKGQQTVQVVHVHNEGQAIVAQNVSAMGEGWGKNPWIEPLALWDSVQRPAKDQNSIAEIGLSVRGQPAACMVGVLEDQEPKQEKIGHDVLFYRTDWST